MKSKSPP